MAEHEPGGHNQRRPRRRHHSGCGCARVLCLLGTLLVFVYLTIIIVAEKSFGEEHHLTFMLVYMPQPPLLLPMAAMVLLSLLARARRLVIGNAVLLLVGIVALLPPTIPHRARLGGKQPLRVVTWNVHESYHETPQMREVLESLKPDIVCLQEARRKDFAEVLPGAQAAHTHEVTTLTRGRIVSSRALRLGAYPNYRHGLETVIDLPQGRVRVLNVHFITAFTGRTVKQNSYDLAGFLDHTREGRENETATVVKWLQEPGENKIVAGDFNTPPNAEIYRRISAEATNAFVAGRGWGLTYRRERPMVRIDHIFVKDGPKPVQTFARDGKVSDHRLVAADLVLSK
ncbi:MAG: endonuclease/exonuclease/phosphatase family protein [Armatimonadia bacterium]